MKAGDVLRGKYELVASIGRGGMGEVFRAVHLTSGASVAIKVVSRALLGEILMARLEREAAAATRIQSDFVPRAIEVDRTEDGALFLVMELLEGEPLSTRSKRAGGPLPWSEVRLFGEHVLQALVAAHAAGVVHRDLKPANIFIETMPAELGSDRKVPKRARVLDFGVCKLDGHAGKLTGTGESVGTIAYMAPEQIHGASQVDARADLYSFAVVIYELVCGGLPYGSGREVAVLARKIEKPARPLAGGAKIDVPSGLAAIIDRALERDPKARLASAEEMLRAWRRLGPVAASTRAARGGERLTGTVLTTTDVPREKPNRGALVVAALVLTISLLVGVTLFWHHLVAGGPRDARVPASPAASADAAPASVDEPR